MIECIFTIDYEIYGNGEGSLRELVYEPAEKLREIFLKWDARFVNFVEAAEMEMIERERSDPAIDLVKKQVSDLHKEGFEIGLHLHPQWYNGRYENGKWLLDYNEYNLCTLPRERIEQIVDRSIAYFREVLGQPEFTPFSFRAGNWLFQPTEIAADVLAKRGVKVDSSVFKGGLQHRHKLDYRRALRNGYYWKFKSQVDVPDESEENMLELPIYTHMVLSWKMLNAKRVGLQRKSSSTNQTSKDKLFRLMDVLRLRHPLKFDFCRMTINELTTMVDKVIQEDKKQPGSFKPIVAIGHTKDLVDFDTVDRFLSYLRDKEIPVSTFTEAFSKCKF
jgi:hypothetical protein